MKRIYLVRHGLPEKSSSEKRYIGVTDLSLSARGEEEATMLGAYFLQLLQMADAGDCFIENVTSVTAFRSDGQDESQIETMETPSSSVKNSIRIFTSPLTRCRATADVIYQVLTAGGIRLTQPTVIDALHEIDLGAWEGKTVHEIKKCDPAAYVARGNQLGSYRTPDGESFLEAGLRFQKAVDEILAVTEDEIQILVAHAGVIRAYLSLLTERDINRLMEFPMPYGALVECRQCGNSIDVVPGRVGIRPEEMLDETELQQMYQTYQTPERVIRHMQKVAEIAEELMDRLGDEVKLNRSRVIKACLVHDLCRAEKQHARVSAEAVRKEGYPEIAALVAEHHDASYSETDAAGPLTEAELLFYADKRVQEATLVSIETRFRESRKKCRTPEACVYHDMMYEKTMKIEAKITHTQSLITWIDGPSASNTCSGPGVTRVRSARNKSTGETR